MTKGPTRATVHPYRSSSCRNNLQQQMAPGRHGPWIPLPFAQQGLWVPAPFY